METFSDGTHKIKLFKNQIMELAIRFKEVSLKLKTKIIIKIMFKALNSNRVMFTMDRKY
jgi:hypothetical protein